MSNIASDAIVVFPTTRRIDTFRESRLLTEANITGILKHLSDSDSFLITQQLPVSDDDFIEFVIHGYYIKVTVGAIKAAVGTLSGTGSIYASIELESATTGDATYIELVGQDAEDVYDGLNLSTITPTGENVYYLKILDFNSSDLTLVTNSMVKFNAYSIGLGDINCKVFPKSSS